MGRNQHLFSLDTLLRMTHDVKKNGGRIILTHGTFDLFHIGHLYMLQESAKKGDFLVVGVDSDKNSRRYKGLKRNPIIPENDRMKIIQNLNFVDGVFLLDKDKLGGKDIYRNIYKEFNPDVITIGRNYFAENAVHQDIRNLNSIDVIKIDDDFESTTNIINRVKNFS